MALLGPRKELDTDISFFMNETASRGVCASISTGGSGVALDQGEALATVANNESGVVPLGVLLNDVVNLDLTRQHLNQHKDEVQQGSKVTILKVGEVTTDQVEGTPTMGALAYCGPSGTFTPDANGGSGAFARNSVGRFMSTKDENGYVKVSVNLP